MLTPDQITSVLMTARSIFALSQSIKCAGNPKCISCEKDMSFDAEVKIMALNYQVSDGIYDTSTEVLANCIMKQYDIPVPPPAEEFLRFGYFDIDPYGSNYESLNYQFSLQLEENQNSYDLNFTSLANLKFLVVREPLTQEIKTNWKNTDNNFGTIPDTVLRAPEVQGNYRYYLTRVRFLLDSNDSTINFM